MNKERIKHKNTVLFVEPRNIPHVFVTLDNAFSVLKDDWDYVFYCGKDKKNYWTPLLGDYVELRELEVDNFPEPRLYNDFMKKYINLTAF
jgi:hypothetical protein